MADKDIGRRSLFRNVLSKFIPSPTRALSLGANKEITRREALIAGGIAATTIALTGAEALTILAARSSEILPADGALKDFYDLRDNPPENKNDVLRRIKDVSSKLTNPVLPQNVDGVWINIIGYSGEHEKTKLESYYLDMTVKDEKHQQDTDGAFNLKDLEQIFLIISDKRKVSGDAGQIPGANLFASGNTILEHDIAIGFDFHNPENAQMISTSTYSESLNVSGVHISLIQRILMRGGVKEKLVLINSDFRKDSLGNMKTAVITLLDYFAKNAR